MKKLLITICITMVFPNVFSQNKNYTVKENTVQKVKIQSDYTTLSIEKDESPENALVLNETSKTEAFGFTPFLIDQIPKIPEYISKLLARNKKKYTATYDAKNTLTFKSLDGLPKLKFNRFIYHKDQEKIASEFVLIPQLTTKGFFSFYVDAASVSYSKAKIKKNYTHLVLLLEITVTYASEEKDKIKKTEMKSAALKVPVIVGTNTSISDPIKQNLSDAFPIQNIVEISVKVTETNPFQVKLEEIESIAEDFKEPIAEFFTKLGESLKD